MKSPSAKTQAAGALKENKERRWREEGGAEGRNPGEGLGRGAVWGRSRSLDNQHFPIFFLYP